MDKIDGRRLKPEGREQLRRMVIRLRQQSGMGEAAERADRIVLPAAIRPGIKSGRISQSRLQDGTAQFSAKRNRQRLDEQSIGLHAKATNHACARDELFPASRCRICRLANVFVGRVNSSEEWAMEVHRGPGARNSQLGNVVQPILPVGADREYPARRV